MDRTRTTVIERWTDIHAKHKGQAMSQEKWQARIQESMLWGEGPRWVVGPEGSTESDQPKTEVQLDRNSEWFGPFNSESDANKYVDLNRETFTLICVCPDGENTDYRREHNIFADDKGFCSIDDAWERNENMGSRWCLYPLRLVVDAEDTVVSVCEGFPIFDAVVGEPLQDVLDGLRQPELEIVLTMSVMASNSGWCRAGWYGDKA